MIKQITDLNAGTQSDLTGGKFVFDTSDKKTKNISFENVENKLSTDFLRHNNTFTNVNTFNDLNLCGVSTVGANGKLVATKTKTTLADSDALIISDNSKSYNVNYSTVKSDITDPILNIINNIIEEKFKMSNPLIPLEPDPSFSFNVRPASGTSQLPSISCESMPFEMAAIQYGTDSTFTVNGIELFNNNAYQATIKAIFPGLSAQQKFAICHVGDTIVGQKSIYVSKLKNGDMSQEESEEILYKNIDARLTELFGPADSSSTLHTWRVIWKSANTSSTGFNTYAEFKARYPDKEPRYCMLRFYRLNITKQYIIQAGSKNVLISNNINSHIPFDILAADASILLKESNIYIGNISN